MPRKKLSHAETTSADNFPDRTDHHVPLRLQEASPTDTLLPSGGAADQLNSPNPPSDTIAPVLQASDDPPTTSQRPTKKRQLIGLLAAPGGADLPTLITALGWQAHTIRAALTGLRKIGHDIRKEKGTKDSPTRYRIVTAAPSTPVPEIAP